jgi:hypothetical protein
VSLDPELASVLLAAGVAALIGLPDLRRMVRRRSALRRFCARCGRILVLGERTCDCEP